MKKLSRGLPRLVPLAGVILVCMSQNAFADFTLGETTVGGMPVEARLYGFINGEIENVKALGGATPYNSRGRVTDGNSRIGFAGSIGVTPDVKGIWQIEASLNSFDQGGVNDQNQQFSLSSRNTFVGVRSEKFGQAVIGNNDSVYRSLVGSGGALGGNLGLTVYGLDVWNNTSAQMTGNPNSLFSRGEARYKNSVHYLSPEWKGLQAGASYSFDEAQTNNVNHGRYSFGLKYHIGEFAVGAGYDYQSNTGVDTAALAQGMGFRTTSVSGQSTSFAKILATYKFPTKTTVGAGYEYGSYGFTQFVPPSGGNFVASTINGSMKQGSVMVSVAQEITPKIAIMASYGKLGNLSNPTVGNPGDYSARQFSIGATYKVNEIFMPYVYYTKISNSSGQNVNLGQAPLFSNNSGTSNAFLAPGNSPQAFGIGLIARF
ncbi:porin [Cupriavidus sp. BIS7]|uniref:porin n=1 Tax=Cupriavidus sp. BIS7 TaxID=1217718 RepID=UPI0009FD7E2D|nr:porin [Cupriavidus sp. BIS7]